MDTGDDYRNSEYCKSNPVFDIQLMFNHYFLYWQSFIGSAEILSMAYVVTNIDELSTDSILIKKRSRSFAF